MKKDLLRSLPKIDELLKNKEVEEAGKGTMRTIIVESLRETIEFYRQGILKDEIEEVNEGCILETFRSILNDRKGTKLRKVINASGIIIHTNLGRSVLSKDAVESVMMVAENYNNLEYDIEKGERGSRYSHIEELLKKVTGAEAAMVVNNNAAAVMLALDTLCRGREAIVSRGQLVEVGGSFRIPDVMAFGGARLVEVGTTNRTHLYDYENHINENTGVLLKVHTSNFKIVGFTEEVSIEELVNLGREKEIPVMEDIGSGVLVDFSKYGLVSEPTIQESIRKGIDVVTFSGDKLLGGPQAGIIVGRKKYIDRMKQNQLTRALRIDKMTLAALEGTLRLYMDESEAIKNIPTLHMILSSKEEVKKKANSLKRRLQNATKDISFIVREDYSMIGGGSMPTERLETYIISIKSESHSPQYIEKKLRFNNIPIIARVYNGEVLLDLRTIFDKDFDVIIEAFKNMGEVSR